MPVTVDVQSIPSELLRNILSHVRIGGRYNGHSHNGQESIKQCRLVSRCFNNAASTFLFTRFSVELTLESFARVERICNHPVFSKNVQQVMVNISFYEPELACNRQLYMQEARGRLLRHVETMERSRSYKRRFDTTDEVIRWLNTLAWGPSPELDQLVRGEVDETSATRIQKLFIKLYDIYKQKYDNQQHLRRNETHISRLCDALCSLSGLVSLELEDPRIFLPNKLTAAEFPDSGLGPIELQHFECALRKSRWSGSFYTGNSANTPPIEMLGDLFSQLGERGLRPRTMGLTLTPPPNMRALQLSSTQQANLEHLISRCTELKLDVDFDARHHTLGPNTRDDMLRLCSITQPFFRAPHLKSLDIWFKGYPSGFSSGPSVSLADILPLDTAWPQLETLRLSSQPATISELRRLIAQYSKTLRRFGWFSGWLLDGSWVDAFDSLRSLHALEEVSIKYPDGAEFKDNGDLRFKIEADKISSYIRKETDINPLRNDGRLSS